MFPFGNMVVESEGGAKGEGVAAEVDRYDGEEIFWEPAPFCDRRAGGGMSSDGAIATTPVRCALLPAGSIHILSPGPITTCLLLSGCLLPRLSFRVPSSCSLDTSFCVTRVMLGFV